MQTRASQKRKYESISGLWSQLPKDLKALSASFLEILELSRGLSRTSRDWNKAVEQAQSVYNTETLFLKERKPPVSKKMIQCFRTIKLQRAEFCTYLQVSRIGT